MVDQQQTPTLPQRKATRLNQMVDVSRKSATPGDSLVFTADGDWEPQDVTPGPGEVTDVMIGNRTIDDTTAATSTGTLITLLNGIANLIKQITGNASWVTAPPINLTALLTHAARHATGGSDAITPASINAATDTHTHANADAIGHAGFMSTGDKAKLDGIANGATNLTLTSSTPNAVTVGAAGAVGSSITAAHGNHSHPAPDVASATLSGFMSATDKAKLDGIEAGATNTILGGSGQVFVIGQSPSSGTSTTASRSDHKHGVPLLANNINDGFMSSADKVKLDGLSANPAGNNQKDAYALADRTLSTTAQIPSGMTWNIGTSGTYFIAAQIDFICSDATDVGVAFTAQLYKNGLPLTWTANFTGNTVGDRATIALHAIEFFAGGDSFDLRVKKASGSTTTSKAQNTSTHLVAFQIS